MLHGGDNDSDELQEWPATFHGVPLATKENYSNSKASKRVAMVVDGPNHRLLQRTMDIRFLAHRVGLPPSIDAP